MKCLLGEGGKARLSYFRTSIVLPRYFHHTSIVLLRTLIALPSYSLVPLILPYTPTVFPCTPIVFRKSAEVDEV